jgi:hypothetical protein
MLLNAITKAAFYKKVIVKFEKSSTNLVYYNKKIKRIDLIIKINKNIRITKKINEIDKNSVNYQNLIQSLRAN